MLFRSSPQQHSLPVMLPTAAALPAQVWRLASTVLRTRMQKMLDGIQTQGIPWTRPLLLLRAQQPPVRQNIPVTSKPQSQRHQVTSLLQRIRMVQVFNTIPMLVSRLPHHQMTVTGKSTLPRTISRTSPLRHPHPLLVMLSATATPPAQGQCLVATAPVLFY